jgi:hypothetical protein
MINKELYEIIDGLMWRQRKYFVGLLVLGNN